MAGTNKTSLQLNIILILTYKTKLHTPTVQLLLNNCYEIDQDS